MSSSTVSTRGRQDVVRLCHQGLPAGPLLTQLLARVRPVVRFDASFWSVADPATLLPTGGVVHNLPLDSCEPYFEHELLVPDVNKFAELAGAGPHRRRAQRGHRWRPSAKRAVPGDR